MIVIAIIVVVLCCISSGGGLIAYISMKPPVETATTTEEVQSKKVRTTAAVTTAAATTAQVTEAAATTTTTAQVTTATGKPNASYPGTCADARIDPYFTWLKNNVSSWSEDDRNTAIAVICGIFSESVRVFQGKSNAQLLTYLNKCY